ncbi:hypothetical protein HU200_032232 [Digitaria exilis]|uniref:Uncharacterized protein n=1 Tax=Digitaria exilis TaxID=1010633 RepID=A0A835BXA3_9POAL|nr:hypothetical protein HU200_032232 [Digitaria exilis]CAB3487359.1 unnamed protein product [Digitaria exilis]
MKWVVLDVDGVGERDELVDLAYDVDAGEVYCVTASGDVHVLRVPRGNRRRPIVERLQRELAGVAYDPAAAYAAPYDVASEYTCAKNVFFFGGNLYQA